MRRIFCLFLALALAGCAAAPDASSAPSSGEDPAPAALVSASQTANSAGFFDFYYDPARPQAGTRLARWDFADLSMHIACTVDGCDHTGEGCEARLSGYPLTVLEDGIYALDRDPDEEIYTLWERDGQGLHPRLVGRVGYWFFFGADETYLYGFCDGAFGRVSRTDGTETYLTHGLQETFSTYGRVLGVWQDRFVAVNWDIDGRQPARICLLDTQGGVAEIAQVDPEHFSDYDCALIGGEVFYLDPPTGDVLAVDLSTGETRTATGALRAYNAREEGDFYKCQRWYLSQVGTTPIVRMEDLADGGPVQTVFRLNEDGTATELPQRQEMRDFDPQQWPEYAPYYSRTGQADPVTVMAQWQEQLVVLCAMQFYTLETESGPSLNTRNVYALTEAADYLAGRENYREFALPEGEVEPFMNSQNGAA